MDFKLLKVDEVKKAINENKLQYREFFIKKDVYGIVDDDGKVLAMAGVSENKQLIGAKKIYNPFYVDFDIGRKLIKCLIIELTSHNKNYVIYTDCLTDDVHLFHREGFKHGIVKNNLKRYGKLWRMTFNG